MWYRVLIFVGLMSSGCATSGHWTHPTATELQFKQDKYQCEQDLAIYEGMQRRDSDYEAGEALGRLLSGKRSASQSRLFQCMEAKGYVFQKETK